MLIMMTDEMITGKKMLTLMVTMMLRMTTTIMNLMTAMMVHDNDASMSDVG